MTFVWDWLLVERKTDILFYAALAVIGYSKDNILECSDTVDCSTLLKDNLAHIPAAELVRLAMEFKSKISSDELEKIRTDCYRDKKQELGEIQMRRDIQSMLGTVPCTLTHFSPVFLIRDIV